MERGRVTLPSIRQNKKDPLAGGSRGRKFDLRLLVEVQVFTKEPLDEGVDGHIFLICCLFYAVVHIVGNVQRDAVQVVFSVFVEILLPVIGQF